MKSLFKLTSITLIIFAVNNLNAQLNITIEKTGDQDLPKAQILSADFMTGDLTEWGNIDADGKTSFDLDYDYMKNIMKEAEKQQKDAPQGWTMSFHTVGSKHECSKYASENSIVVENPDAKLFGLPPFFAGEKSTETNYGFMYAASNIDIAKWLHSYQMDSAAKGFYAEWIYVEKESSVKGSCVMQTMTGYESEELEVVTTYDLNFEEGWNLMLFTIEDVFNSASGKVFVAKTKITTAQFIPEELQWFVVED